MKSTLLRLLAALFTLSLVAAACGSDDDTTDNSGALADAEAALAEAEAAKDAAEAEAAEAQAAAAAAEAEAAEAAAAAAGEEVNPLAGTAVRITGPVRSPDEVAGLQGALDIFAEANDMTIFYVGSADWESEINVQIEAGTPPDISIFPQPGKLADFARDGYVVALPDAVTESVSQNWSDGAMGFGNVDGTQYGVPDKTDLKSLVWYQPARFEADGYSVPETFDDFVALVEEMAAAGGPKPLCIGIESGQATGWTFTDWVEDMVLRQHGPDVYDQWVSHDIPFNDDRIVGTMQTVLDLWTEDNVFASAGSIAATAFQDNGQPLVDGDCYMHRQASFYAAFIPEGTPFADGTEGAVDVFYFPDINGDAPVLGAGTLAAGFNDDPSTMALLAYMSTPDYAEARQVKQSELKGGGLSGFLSAAQGQDPSVYAPLEQSFLEILETAAIVRFDASDLMPADVGAGTFWTDGTSAVNGDLTAQEAADSIEASWPAG